MNLERAPFVRPCCIYIYCFFRHRAVSTTSANSNKKLKQVMNEHGMFSAVTTAKAA